MIESAIQMAAASDPGRKKPRNEDHLGFFEPGMAEDLSSSGRLYIVADGVGGGAAGEVASQFAVERVLHSYFGSADPDLGRRLETAVGLANADIHTYVGQRPELRRMGTTLVAAGVRGRELVVGNIGDSRAYLVRGGEIQQITKDHSFVQRLVDEGSITAEEASQHPRKNVLLRCVGLEPEARLDLFARELCSGDMILLCSDGLTRYLSDEEVLSVIERSRMGRAVKRLARIANSRGGADNITVLLLRIEEASQGTGAGHALSDEQMPSQPDLASLHEQARQRREAPRGPRSPAWLWLVLATGLGLIAAVCTLIPSLLGLGAVRWLELAAGAALLLMALILAIYCVIKLRWLTKAGQRRG